MKDYPIDIVIPWVDGNDPKWRAEYNKYCQGKEFDVARYRDWDLLKYWFRGIEQFAPWVNKIYFVTMGQIPEWLNLEAPKLVHINHEDYIPKQYLPTFNSSAIEYFFPSIPGLSEHFIIFNDDMYLTAPISTERFFKDGIPCDMAIEYPTIPKNNAFSKNYFNNIAYINTYFNKKEVIKQNFSKWFNIKYKKSLFRNIFSLLFPSFVGFRQCHYAQSHLKSIYEEVYALLESEIESKTMTRFRDERNITQHLLRMWQLCSGKFYPINCHNDSTSIEINDRTLEKCVSTIKNKKYSMICLNDTTDIKDFASAQKQIDDAFRQILPNKSIYEK